MNRNRKAKEVYYDTTGDMVKSTLGLNLNNYIKSPVEGKTLTKRFRLVDIQRHEQRGVTFWFEDNTGRRYPMGDGYFKEYLQKHPIDFGEQTTGFYKYGHVYSIGFIEGE